MAGSIILVIVLGLVSGVAGAWIFWRWKIGGIPPIVLPPRVVGRPAMDMPYEVRMDGKRIYPGEGQECTREGAKSTYFDPKLPIGKILEYYQHGSHTASRRT